MKQINQMNIIHQYNQMNQMNQNNNINQMNNMNFFNKMIQMNFMNLMNQWNQMNQNNYIIQMHDIDPKNLMIQINKIIQMNPILTNPKKEILSQLCQLYQNINRVNQIFGVSEFEDHFSFTPVLKKCIYFIRSEDGKRFGIKIPYFLKSYELYQIAEKYQLYKYSDLELFYKNNYLKEDETPIGLISNGEEINFIEKKKENCVMFYFETGDRKVMSFTLDTTVKEMIKMFCSENRISEKEKSEIRFLFDAETLDFNDNSTLFEKGMTRLTTITVIRKIFL